MRDQLKALSILVALVLLWPVCAAAWLIQWPLVKWTLRAPRRPPAGPAVDARIAIAATPIGTIRVRRPTR